MVFPRVYCWQHTANESTALICRLLGEMNECLILRTLPPATPRHQQHLDGRRRLTYLHCPRHNQHLVAKTMLSSRKIGKNKYCHPFIYFSKFSWEDQWWPGIRRARRAHQLTGNKVGALCLRDGRRRPPLRRREAPSPRWWLARYLFNLAPRASQRYRSADGIDPIWCRLRRSGSQPKDDCDRTACLHHHRPTSRAGRTRHLNARPGTMAARATTLPLRVLMLTQSP